MEDVLAIGVELSQEESGILCLPPKTSLNPSLSEVEFETQVEVSFAKARYSLRDELEDEPGGGGEVGLNVVLTNTLADTEQEDKDLKKKVKEVEARTRMVYDNIAGTLEMGKRRVTDLSLIHI